MVERELLLRDIVGKFALKNPRAQAARDLDRAIRRE